MSTYTYPQMPLRANVWHQLTELPPTQAPDRADVPCSCSPISPADFATTALNTQLYRAWTHIIRTAVDPDLVDNYERGDERQLLPVSAFEIPAGSGHYYVVLWAHVVGAGFGNEHARLHAARYTKGNLADLPFFRGWI